MAAENVGDLLFQRGQEDDNEEDIWDDTALIKAYDEAVSMVKMKAAEQNGIPFTEQDMSTAGKVQKKKKKAKKPKKVKWKVGDRCRARFTEDNLLYEAEIISVDSSNDTCYVRYVDYGNEEEHDMADLLVVKIKRQRSKQQPAPSISQSDIETDSGMEFFPSKPSPVRHRSQTSTSSHQAKVQPGPPTWGAPAQDPMMSGFVPPMFPGMTGMSQPAPSWNSPQRIPMMPPPPPPPPPVSDAADGDNEPLCSMLMSWYMSGYHTGYYQGLQQGRKQSACSSPFVNR